MILFNINFVWILILFLRKKENIDFFWILLSFLPKKRMYDILRFFFLIIVWHFKISSLVIVYFNINFVWILVLLLFLPKMRMYYILRYDLTLDIVIFNVNFVWILILLLFFYPKRECTNFIRYHLFQGKVLCTINQNMWMKINSSKLILGWIIVLSMGFRALASWFVCIWAHILTLKESLRLDSNSN